MKDYPIMDMMVLFAIRKIACKYFSSSEYNTSIGKHFRNKFSGNHVRTGSAIRTGQDLSLVCTGPDPVGWNHRDTDKVTFKYDSSARGGSVHRLQGMLPNRFQADYLLETYNTDLKKGRDKTAPPLQSTLSISLSGSSP